MAHPLFKNFLGRVIFLSVWIAISVIHAATFHFVYSVPAHLALVDSIIWNTFFAVLSIGLWFWVRMSDIETSKPLSIFINHLGAASLSIVVIVYLHRYILQNMLIEVDVYPQHFEQLESSRYVVGFFYYLLIALVYYLVFYIISFREKMLREAELKTLVKEAELTWLKLQINPHFLFNSLNSISSLTITAPDKAQEMLNGLSELLRYSLKQSPNSMVSLSDEVENCKKYLAIEQVRFGDRLKYNFDYSNEALQIFVPSMVLQPLFENAIKHSVAQTDSTSIITAQFTQTSVGVCVSIINSLPETPASSIGTGVGLENIKRRLQLMYGTATLLNVDKSYNKFTVTIDFPDKILS